MIVKGDGPPPPPSVSNQVESKKLNQVAWEQARGIIQKLDQQDIWDNLQARDLPAELIDYVVNQLEAGFTEIQIRRALGIPRATDKAWKKISAALRQGIRIDGTAFLMKAAYRNERLKAKLLKQFEDAIDNGVPHLDGDGVVHYLKGPHQAINQIVDVINRLDQGFVKMGKDLGAFVEGEGSGSGKGGGVTIVVNSTVPLPELKTVKAHNAAEREKNLKLLEDARQSAIPTTSVPLPDAVPKPKT